MDTAKQSSVKRIVRIALLVLVAVGIFAAGCDEPVRTAAPTRSGRSLDALSSFAASNIGVMGLTEIVKDADRPGKAKLKAYIDLLDQSGVRIKNPGTFRLELYEFVPRSSDPTGKRLAVWPDINLEDAQENNRYWRDFLRTYQFELNMAFAPQSNTSYVLQVTFSTPLGKRLSGNYQIKYSE
jgi:hypothetical protein